MLITTCPHCQARFRVTPQQLNAKQGQVRCGKCHQVFSGFEALVRIPDDDTGTRLLAAREAQERGAPPEPPPPPDTRPVESVPLETVDDAPPPSEPEHEPEPDGDFEPEPESRPSQPLPIAETARPGAPRRDLRGVAIEEPEFALEPPERPRPSRAWSLGVVLLLLVIGIELAYAFRATLAQQYPVLRPGLEAVCARAGCTVPYARDNSALKLEESDLLEVPGRPGEIALAARVRNLGTVAQEYPHLELTLTDLTGQVAARRVLRPADYLGRSLVAGDVLQPGTEVALMLRLETPRLKPTGYELLLFYP